MIRFLMDENMPHAVGDQLRRREPTIEVFSVGDNDSPTIGTPDPTILIWIEEHEACLVSRNRRTMPDHLTDHIAGDRHVPGIFLIKRDQSLGEVIEDLLLLLARGEDRRVSRQYRLLAAMSDVAMKMPAMALRT